MFDQGQDNGDGGGEDVDDVPAAGDEELGEPGEGGVLRRVDQGHLGGKDGDGGDGDDVDHRQDD